MLKTFALFLLLFCFSLTPAILPADDISFINGTWTNTVGEPEGCAPNTIAFHLQTVNLTDIKGTADVNCHHPITCVIIGQVDSTANTIQADFECNDGTTNGSFQGSFTSDRTKMNLDFDCPNCNPPDFSVTMVKQKIGFENVSQSSGIAQNDVRTTAVQWIDFNNDKRLDLYLVGSNGNALFKNVGGGKFVDVTQKVKIGNNGKNARSAAWADINNDGLTDVFIANATGSPTLLLNKKNVFRDISSNLASASITSETTVGGLWMDINGDRLIDLFVVRNGAPNQMFKHVGATGFQDIAGSAGLAGAGAGRSAVSADFDADGFQDIYVANFKQSNRLYLNNGDETFRDASASAGVGFKGGSVQSVAVDYNGDQRIDIFVVNNNGPSVLFQNLGNGKFKNVTPSLLKKPKKGIAAQFADYDKDGDQDLVMAESSGPNFLFQNIGKGRFKELKSVNLSTKNPTGISIGDFNNDGIPDIAIGSGNDSRENGDSLFRSDGGAGNNFLTVTLQGKESNRSAIGARVLLATGLLFQLKEVSGGNGSSQESLPLEFGLGPATIVDSVRVIWPSGKNQTLQNVKINQSIKITEP